MSSTGWARAAPLYKIEIPNDPHLGWSPPRARVLLWTTQGLLMVGFLYFLIGKPASVFLICLVIGFSFAGAVVAYFHHRDRRKATRCEPLSDDQLRQHVIDVQTAITSQETDEQEHRRLGLELGVEPVTAVALCVVGSAIMFAKSISFTLVGMISLVLLPVVVSNVLASRWVARFNSRIKNRDCVACGYTPGKSSPQLVVCPECGVLLPVMEAATTSRGDQP